MRFVVTVFFMALGLVLVVSLEKNERNDQEVVPESKMPRRSPFFSPSSLNNSDENIEMESLEGIHLHRLKRATWNNKEQNWPHFIPYKFAASLTPAQKLRVKNVLNEVMNRICVVWIEEPLFDPKANNYESNSYIEFVYSQSSCSSKPGRGKKEGRMIFKVCDEYTAIVRALLHSLGSIAERQGPLRDNYMSIVEDNIVEKNDNDLYKKFKTKDGSKVVSKEFDASSIMQTKNSYGTKNGLDVVLPFRDDQFNLNGGLFINLENSFYELNRVYKCRDNCANMNCGIGYRARIQDTCRCFCPDGYVPSRNCRSLHDQSSVLDAWPDAPFTIYADDDGNCPQGFTSGQLTITTNTSDGQEETLVFHMCSKEATKTRKYMNLLPMGDYCVIKPKGLDCDGPFTERSIMRESTKPIIHSGAIGDSEIQTSDPLKLKMKLCCRMDKDFYYPIGFPATEKFGLPSIGTKSCQKIKGMREKMMPRFEICQYTPPRYGCNRKIGLKKRDKFTIVTPGFWSRKRESNRRCFYSFRVPKGDRIKITMNTFDIGVEDFFFIKRFNRWSLPQVDFLDNFQPEFISEQNFVFIEYWSGPNDSDKKGVKFTATKLTKKKNCYDADTRGVNYDGDKSVTENFDECLPWSAAGHCEDFPGAGNDFSASRLKVIDLMASSNKCRNPGRLMKSPFCYVSVQRGMCKKAYCDVCNNLDDLDQLTNCRYLISIDPEFCHSASQRFKCSKSCALKINKRHHITKCSRPVGPKDGESAVDLKDEYNLGDVVHFLCKTNGSSGLGTDMTCTAKGWTTPGVACGCQSGWIRHGDRCLYLHEKKLSMSKADKYCQNMNARVMIIRNSDDIKSLVKIRQAYHWINMYYDGEGKGSLYDDRSVLAPFIEWHPLMSAVNVLGDCVEALVPSGMSRSRCYNKEGFFCEIPKDKVCVDKSPFCIDALNQDPELCNKMSRITTSYCSKSCGLCKGDNTMCTNPGTLHSRPVLSINEVRVGEVMEFTCDPGYYLLKGHLKRKCGSNGQFLGESPICTHQPVSIDYGVDDVLPQSSDVPSNSIFLLDAFGFRITTNGKVTHWHYYGVKKGNVHFVVYRRTGTRGVFKFVGYNTIRIDTINKKWTAPVPLNEQFSVQVGDLYGVLNTDGKIAATLCNDKNLQQKLMMVWRKEKSCIDDLTRGTLDFKDTFCMFPSLGVRVKPSTSEDQLSNCLEMKENDVSFCINGNQRHLCVKTCSYPEERNECSYLFIFTSDNYKGSLHQSKDSRLCVPWSETKGCELFPYSSPDSPLVEADENYCRNHGERMNQPWCFTSGDQGTCKAELCDVCRQDYQEMADCYSYMDNDKMFCSSALQRSLCAYKCQIELQILRDIYTYCEPPKSLPHDALLISPKKSYYKINDFISLRCNIRADKSPPIKYTCSKDGWSNMNSVCSECPEGWMPHGDRCLFYKPGALSISDANAYCNSSGSQLLRVLSEEDIVEVKWLQTTGSGLHDGNDVWLNLKSIKDGEWTLYDDNTEGARNVNGDPYSELHYPDKRCFVITVWNGTQEQYPNGKIYRVDCKRQLARFTCEKPKPTSKSCDNEFSPSVSTGKTCEYYNYETFTIEKADSECRKRSSHLSVVRNKIALMFLHFILKGQFQLGYHWLNMKLLENGTLGKYRDSSSTESFVLPKDTTYKEDYCAILSGSKFDSVQCDCLKASTVCELPRIPITTDVNIKLIFQRPHQLPTDRVFLFDVHGYRMPMVGKVTHWHFYAVKKGRMHFVVYRRNHQRKVLEYVGHNTFDVVKVNYRWTSVVALNDQFVVGLGNIFGVYSPDGVISVTKCEDLKKGVLARTEQVSSVELMRSAENFRGKSCIIPAIGFRIKPFSQRQPTEPITRRIEGGLAGGSSSKDNDEC